MRVRRVKALIVANHFQETELEKLRAAVSTGYARGKLYEAAKTLPRDQKDWYDQEELADDEATDRG
jgi:hypothetical protein